MGSFRRGSFGGLAGLAALVFCTSLPSAARGDAFEGHQLFGQFNLPPGAAAFDALGDGRLIAIAGANVYRETVVGARTFSLLGSLAGADIPSFGAAFLKASPDGSLLAVGNNGGALGNNYQVGVFDSTSLTGAWFTAAHFDGEWVDNARLALTAGDFVNPSVVTILDTTSNPQSPSNEVVIDSIGGASGGIAFDANGALLTGNGFQFGGPSGTGAVKAFSVAQWTTALIANTPLDFEAEGLDVIDILSASPMGFDDEGNLFVGGGDFSAGDQTDFVAVVRASAVASAISGGGSVDTNGPSLVRRLDPDQANDSNFYSAAFNPLTGELYVRDGGSDVVYVCGHHQRAGRHFLGSALRSDRSRNCRHARFAERPDSGVRRPLGARP